VNGHDESLDPRLTYAAVTDATVVDPGDILQNELLRQGLLIAGNVLVQNPYRPQQYAVISEADEKFALNRFFIFSLLCQQLGAKAVQIRALEQTRKGVSRKRERARVGRLFAAVPFFMAAATSPRWGLPGPNARITGDRRMGGAGYWRGRRPGESACGHK